MKKNRHYLRFTLLMAILFTIAPPAVAESVRVEDNGIAYYIYYEGELENAIGTYAECSGAYDESITTANIRSSISYSFEEYDYVYDEIEDEWKEVLLFRHTITAPVTEINYGAFTGCSNLTSVKIPNSVTKIGGIAFSSCSNLKSVTIPNSVTEIGRGAFSDCTGLTSVRLPNSVTVIGENAFKYCSSLTSVTIGNSVTEIGYSAFENCTSLTSVTIPNSVTKIGYSAFENCSSLTSVTIPNSVTEIGFSAFENCTSLTSVTIPNSVTCIDLHAFAFCDSLQDIYSKITNPSSVELHGSVFLCVPNQSCVLHVPPGSEDLYREARQWKDFIIMGSYEMKTDYSKGFMSTNSHLFDNQEKNLQGVTADGESRMYIYLDEDISNVKSITKKIKIDGQEVTDPEIIGNLGEFKKLPNGKFGFDYRAPEDFPEVFSIRNKYEISLEIQVVNNSNKEWVGYKTITVMRPGVLLLHGLWGNYGAFESQYWHLITKGGYESYQVWNVDYSSSNTMSFSVNTFDKKVVETYLTGLFFSLFENGIISSKYDLVGHSMGGILSRLYAQEVNPDAVNRIITLDTPHYGSQLADLREPILDLCRNKSESDEFTVIPKRIYKKYYDMLSKPEYDAIQDLKPSSEAIMRLNSKSCAGIPVHAIGSYMTPPSVGERFVHELNPVWQVFLDLAFFEIPEYAQYLNNSDLGYSLMNYIYNGHNDGIVPLTSQLGGLSDNVTDIEVAQLTGEFGRKSNAHHTKTHHWDVTMNAITGLLRSPKNSSSFTTSGFRAPANYMLASEQPAITSVPEFKEAPETSFINLSLNKNEDEYDRNLEATVTTSDDIERFIILACLDDDKCLVSAWDTEPTFVIPDNYEGNLVFYALGRTANDELVADMDSVEYSSITSLAALDFEDYDDLTMCVGQTLGLNVIATWDNGESEYVKPTYSATPGGILNIDGQMFTPVAVGECELIAEYKGLTCTKKITVYPGSEPVTSRYDVNLDGEVNIADVNAVISLILLPEGGTLGDVNGDGEVNIADINAIIDEILSN